MSLALFENVEKVRVSVCKLLTGCITLNKQNADTLFSYIRLPE